MIMSSFIIFSILLPMDSASSFCGYEYLTKIAIIGPLFIFPVHIYRDLYESVIIKHFSIRIPKTFGFCVFYLQIVLLLVIEAEKNINVFT